MNRLLGYMVLGALLTPIILSRLCPPNTPSILWVRMHSDMGDYCFGYMFYVLWTARQLGVL